MADEELHETTADDQNDQSTDDTAAVEGATKPFRMPLKHRRFTFTARSADSDDDDDHDDGSRRSGAEPLPPIRTP